MTNQVTTDLISAPLLWVIPLAVYLASFVIVFSVRGRRLLPLAIVAAPAASRSCGSRSGAPACWPIVPLLVVEYLGLGVAAVALHGRLAESRPPDRHLTEFYLLLSTGGALGGLFVAIVAPLAFDGVWELPILIVAALAALALTAPPLPRMRPSRRMLHGAVPRMVPYLVVVIPLLLLVAQSGDTAFTAAWRWALVGGLVLLFGGDGKFLTLTTAVVLILATFVLAPPAVFRDRSFFGVTEVLRTDTETILMHGTTAHGRQALDPARPGDPGSYYARAGPDRRRVPAVGRPSRRAGSSSWASAPARSPRTPARGRPGVLRDRSARRARRGGPGAVHLPGRRRAAADGRDRRRPAARRRTSPTGIASTCWSSTPSRRMRRPATC